MTRNFYRAKFIVLALSLGLATASVRAPRGDEGMAGGNVGPSGCPTASLDGTIEQVELFVSKEHEKPFRIKADSQTSYRVPGVKRKELAKDGLSKLPLNAAAKIRFCTNDGRLLEVKVKKEKPKTTT
jgi:hypothetical protein